MFCVLPEPEDSTEVASTGIGYVYSHPISSIVFAEKVNDQVDRVNLLGWVLLHINKINLQC